MGNGTKRKWTPPADDHEREIRALGFELIAGVDEAGRGALAGPVVAGAVLLPRDLVIEGVRDSKLVPEPEREELYEMIVARALCWGVGIVGHGEIDRINILQATFVAMRQALAALALRPEYVMIDGRDALDVGLPCRAIIDGDALCSSIAAASIIAKVTRDRIMRGLDEQFPGYGFARHKGYGTDAHRQAIRDLGPCGVHRFSFLGNILQQNPDL